MTLGHVVIWAQADRRRGGGFGFAHLFWFKAGADGSPLWTSAVCGYDPARHDGVAGVEPLWRTGLAVPDDAPRCSRCEARADALVGHTFYPLGQHPVDVEAAR